jgi:tetratricopeptide (TPR) repeat protein
LQISRRIDNIEGVARGLENLGRVYARQGEFSKAIEVWEEKLPMCKNDLEITWLNHEIGRCYLELGNYIIAKNYGSKSLEKAEIINDECWKMNALVLMAQSENKLKENANLEFIIECFNKSLKLSIKLKDRIAENALKKAIEQAKQKQEALKSSDEKSGFENDFEVESSDKTSLSSKDSTTSLSSQESNKLQTLTDVTNSIIKIATNESYGVEEIYLTLYGANDLTRKIKLDKSESNEIPFKSGQLDVFKIEDIDTLGDVCTSYTPFLPQNNL